MSSPAKSAVSSGSSRRDFLRNSTTAVVGGALASGVVLPRAVHADGGDVLRVGLIGCGGRGTGAAHQALNADKNVKLVAVGDAFADRLESSLNTLKKAFPDKVAVENDHKYVGFDAYQKVIAAVDVVLLTSPPHFRPAHLAAAVAAGKHIFCEKPVAVDGPGCRSVFATVEEARKKKLSLVSGLCWRYDYGVRETMKRVLDGQIGKVVAMQENYNTGPLWHNGRQPQWSEMEYQMRNWLYFTWLSGDHNVEQHIHSLDKALWAMNDEPPVKATGLGGRQVRVDPQWGHIFDHHAVCYEFANGVRCYSYTRQQANCSSDVEDYFLGSKGQCRVLKHEITGENPWKYKGPKPDMYQVEHNELFASIRSGNPINNGVYMTRSTLMAIMGRMATYTGKTISWDDALNSKEDLSPAKYEWGPLPVPQVAKPGVTQFT